MSVGKCVPQHPHPHAAENGVTEHVALLAISFTDVAKNFKIHVKILMTRLFL